MRFVLCVLVLLLVGCNDLNHWTRSAQESNRLKDLAEGKYIELLPGVEMIQLTKFSYYIVDHERNKCFVVLSSRRISVSTRGQDIEEISCIGLVS